MFHMEQNLAKGNNILEGAFDASGADSDCDPNIGGLCTLISNIFLFFVFQYPASSYP